MATLEGLVSALGRSSRADLALAYMRGLSWVSQPLIGCETDAQVCPCVSARLVLLRAAVWCCHAIAASQLAGDAAQCKQNDAVTYMHSRAITDPWLAHHLQLQANVDLCTTPPVRLFRSGCCCCMSVLMVPTVRPINLSIILHGGWCVSAMVARV
eukprot:COSAG01_NODE_9379_length_2462_cov_11.333898_3_plen_155_part_00